MAEVKHDILVHGIQVDLRDYFAGLAMQSFISMICADYLMEDVADDAYNMADAMMEARK